MRYLRQSFPMNQFGITSKACVLRHDDMKRSVVKSANMNGFTTNSGEEVVRTSTPRHSGGNNFLCNI